MRRKCENAWGLEEGWGQCVSFQVVECQHKWWQAGKGWISTFTYKVFQKGKYVWGRKDVGWGELVKGRGLEGSSHYHHHSNHIIIIMIDTTNTIIIIIMIIVWVQPTHWVDRRRWKCETWQQVQSAECGHSWSCTNLTHPLTNALQCCKGPAQRSKGPPSTN